MPTQRKKIDQNLLGEGQFFGTNLSATRTVVNGSIRSMSVSRPGTANSMRPGISPYTHNTHALAASSMYDLSNVSHIRQGSFKSLKPAASERDLRGKLAGPAGSSMTSLRVPGPGYGSRPGTPSSARGNKKWVNPLDVHFGRATPSGVPQPPRSPLAQYEVNPMEEGTGSMFGDKPENVANAIMNNVEKKEKEREEREREEKGKVEREREERVQRQKEQEEREKWIKEQEERERQTEMEKQKAAAAAAAAIRSPQRGPGGYQPGPNGQMGGPVFQGQGEQRPGSRNGNRNGPPMGGPGPVFHGQGDHRPGSRNGSNRPGPPGGPQFQGQMDHRPGSRNGQNDRHRFQGQVDQRPGSRNGQHDRPVFQGQMDQRPGSRNGPRRDGPPHGHYNGPPNGHPNGHHNGPYNGPQNGPRPMNGPGPIRGPGPIMSGQARGPMNGPGPMNRPTNGMNGPGPIHSPPSGQRGPGPMNGHGQSPPNRARDNYNGQNSNGTIPFPDLPSPTGSFPRSSDDRPGQDGKPVIQNVTARRDTLTMNTPRRNSLSMTIEAFEKSLVDAQQAAQTSAGRRDSGASSNYSVDEITRSPPQQQPRPSPPYASVQPPRPESPMRRPMPGKNIQRPNPEEYGVAPVGGRSTPLTNGHRRGNDTSSPSPPSQAPAPPAPVHHIPSLEPAPLFRQPKWGLESMTDHHSNPTADFDFSTPRPSPKPPAAAGMGGSSSSLVPPHRGAAVSTAAATDPVSPPPSNWPLASPPSTTSTAAAGATGTHPQPKRTPAPLQFDFSPDAQSRGPSTPQPMRVGGFLGLMEETRPSTSGNDGIGMARGPSVREMRGVTGMDRRPDYGLRNPVGFADDFGTPLI